MKLTFLSKSVRTIGLVTMLSLTVGMAASATGCTKSGDNKVAIAPAVAHPLKPEPSLKLPLAIPRFQRS
jgi:hypothetical protein